LTAVTSATWPGEGRRSPPAGTPTRALLQPLSDWLRDEAARVHAERGPYRLLDVGCGVKPYYPWFEPYVAEYVGLDIEANAAADVHGTIEAIPAEDASFDVVLCTQVLEHCDDPAQGVRELRRVTRPGGRVLLSTHGVQVYHPAPHDLWRWTHEGLERLFLTNGTWTSVSVSPSSGTAATLALLLSTYIDLAAKRAHARPVGRVVIHALQALAGGVDTRARILREPGPGTLHANYHVTAVV
jgi:SAM-dependent methyltransferase